MADCRLRATPEQLRDALHKLGYRVEGGPLPAGAKA
jgi:hypothetical protein